MLRLKQTSFSKLSPLSMNDFKELRILLQPYFPWAEVLIQELSDLGFHGFQEEEPVLLAYISNDIYNEVSVETILNYYREDVQCKVEIKDIPAKNWNSEWESSFSPVVISDKLIIRALFHEAVPGIENEILLTPKMAFGTGHHATTEMVCAEMLDMDFKSKRILDVGCGTSILSILAEKLGASHILAIDNDDWAVNNSIENLKINNCQNTIVEKAEVNSIRQNSFNVILANINRNVIVNDMPKYRDLMSQDAHLILSGFRIEDVNQVQDLAKTLDLITVNSAVKNDWCMVHLTTKNVHN